MPSHPRRKTITFVTKKKKTPKRLTKRQRKALEGKGTTHQSAHIHCVACGRHIHQPEFTARPSTARWMRCQHGTVYPSCAGCVDRSKQLLAEHDRSGRPVQAAAAWH